MGTTPAERHERGGRLVRIVRSPLGWMLTGLVGIAAVSAVTGALPLLGAVAAVGVYWAVMRYVAKRPTPELARRGAAREVLVGGGIGLGFVFLSTLLITAFGGYSFSWAGNSFFPVVIAAAATMAATAITEELMFRGLALQALERLAGSRIALTLTAVFFGFAHLANPGASLWSSVAIAIEAGVLLGAAFLWRRSIWFVVGLHFTWNTTVQLLGIPVSGHAAEGSLLTAHVTGPALLTGGSFGLEASIITVMVGLALAVPMLVFARRREAV
ncbi:CAAX amino protease [Acrocarpospora pleiomorpha]|uniref:CAAX amino protease n=2 Tax=Acrocarpospora pleiomorpha TaxID=90975 RepID=A0A5M3XFR4_9ACTN|nr:CAAX amino protease [Acrocarpospora pleiomorpha]